MLTTPWIGRLAALLLLIGAIEVVYLLVVEPTVVGYRETDQAIENYAEAVRRDANFAAAHLRLGMLYGRRQETEKANHVRLMPPYAVAVLARDFDPMGAASAASP